MSRALTPGEIKALVRQLVSAVGGVEAAAVECGVSHQMVSNWQNPNNPAQMPFLSICRLEVVAERDIVTGAASRAVTGEDDAPIASAAVESVTASAAALGKIHAMDADGARDAGEIREVQAAASNNLREAQELHDAAMRLTPSHGETRP